MSVSRRHFLRSATSVAAVAPAFSALAGCVSAAPSATARRIAPPLQPDPAGLLDLPEGFSYRVLSRAGEVMSDGLFTPGAFDGMAAFPVAGDADRCLLVRNHELRPHTTAEGAFGPDHAKASGIDPALIYDRAADGRPLLGGTTTLLVNVRAGVVERSHLSLAGTATNCAGGATPWGSWLSCEETEETPGPNARKPHGFIFEVPAGARGLVAPVPLTDMGRCRHEAAAVDPVTGAVYLTEDQGDGLFYRFLPNAFGELAKGGRLQALGVFAQAGADLRNWAPADGGAGQGLIPVGATLDVRWVDLADVTAPDGDLRQRGRQAGAAIFARGEGMATALENGRAVIYFTCTTGGAKKLGQIWRYEPSTREGYSDEAASPGKLVLVAESSDPGEFDMVDNIVAAPWGHLVVCEDGEADNFVRSVAPDGRIFTLARNAHSAKSEFCGACFSPDGSTLFVNVMRPGATFAITGPWSAFA